MRRQREVVLPNDHLRPGTGLSAAMCRAVTLLV